MPYEYVLLHQETFWQKKKNCLKMKKSKKSCNSSRSNSRNDHLKPLVLFDRNQ